MNGCLRLAAALKVSAYLTALLGCLGAIALGTEFGFAAGLLTVGNASFLYLAIRWMEMVIRLLLATQLTTAQAAPFTRWRKVDPLAMR